MTAPFPSSPDPAAYHGIVGELVRTIEPHTEADPVVLLVQFLVGFGNMVGRSPCFRVEEDLHRLNEFAAIVGRTGRGRKGVSWGRVRRPLAAADESWARHQIISGLSSGEGLIHAVRDPTIKREPVKRGNRTVDYEEVIVDHGVGDKRLLVLESELARVLRVMEREGNILSEVIRQAWDSGDFNIANKTSPERATGAHVSIIGHITQEELRRTLDSTEVANGFANRFLWVCSRRSKLLPEGGCLDDQDLAPVERRIAEAASYARRVGQILRGPETRKAWARAYPVLSADRPGLLGAILSRSEAHVTRLSCLYALLDQSDVVEIQHLTAALALWEYIEASARYIFGEALGDPVADTIHEALLRTPSGLTRTDISNLFHRNEKSSRIDTALKALLQNNLARMCLEKTEGRSIERWFAVVPGSVATVGGAEATSSISFVS